MNNTNKTESRDYTRVRRSNVMDVAPLNRIWPLTRTGWFISTLYVHQKTRTICLALNRGNVMEYVSVCRIRLVTGADRAGRWLPPCSGPMSDDPDGRWGGKVTRLRRDRRRRMYLRQDLDGSVWIARDRSDVWRRDGQQSDSKLSCDHTRQTVLKTCFMILRVCW